MSDERYVDCDECGERFHGADIDRWLREQDDGRMLCETCRERPAKAEGGAA